MTGLWLSWVGLAAAPILYLATARRPRAVRAVDVVVLTLLAALIVLVVLPDIVRSAGPVVVLAAVVGFAGPGLVEWRSHRIGHRAHIFALIAAMLGLAVHAMVDGVALSPGHGVGPDPVPHDHAHGAGLSNLGWAIVLHRLPVGLAVWSILARNHGRSNAAAGLTLIAVATWIGWAVGPTLLEGLSLTAFHIFEAFVAGSLLHVVIHRPHAH